MTSLRTGRWVRLDGTTNMRDLGGLPTHDGGTTLPGRVLRSDNLQTLTAEDVRRLGFIRSAQTAGFTLEQIAELIAKELSR